MERPLRITANLLCESPLNLLLNPLAVAVFSTISTPIPPDDGQARSDMGLLMSFCVQVLPFMLTLDGHIGR